ncbi:MAG: helix-turn-helix transcriptional regulator, partial [Verrucomicrobiota bacterium]
FIDIIEIENLTLKMPAIAREALIHKLHATGLLQSLDADLQSLTGLRLVFSERRVSRGLLSRPLVVGSISLGNLILEGDIKNAQLEAVQNWLNMAVEYTLSRLRKETPSREAQKVLPTAVFQTMILIRNRFREKVRLNEMAKEVNLSPERLSRLFKSSTGITFSEYLNQVRLDHCRELLRDGHYTISQVAFDSGFQSLSQFNRRFKSAEGMSPREYQKRS